MPSPIPAKCPNCGANLQIDLDVEVATCAYCNTSSFVQTRARPATHAIPQRALVIDARPKSSVWLYSTLGFVLLLALGTAVCARFVLSDRIAPAHSLSSATGTTAPATSLVVPPTATDRVSPVASVAAPPAPIPGPWVHQASIEVSGPLESAVVERIVRQSMSRFRRCYEVGLEHTPDLNGNLRVHFVITQDGSVRQPEDAGSDVPDPHVVRCVTTILKGISFPTPAGAQVDVRYSLVLSPH